MVPCALARSKEDTWLTLKMSKYELIEQDEALLAPTVNVCFKTKATLQMIRKHMQKYILFSHLKTQLELLDCFLNTL